MLIQLLYLPTGHLVDNLGIAYDTSIENVICGSGNDIIIGNDLSNQISGGLGYDTLSGGSGADIFMFKTSELSNSVISM